MCAGTETGRLLASSTSNAVLGIEWLCLCNELLERMGFGGGVGVGVEEVEGVAKGFVSSAETLLRDVDFVGLGGG